MGKWLWRQDQEKSTKTAEHRQRYGEESLGDSWHTLWNGYVKITDIPNIIRDTSKLALRRYWLVIKGLFTTLGSSVMVISLLGTTRKKWQQMPTRNVNSHFHYSFACDINNMKQGKHRAGRECISKRVIYMQIQSATEAATV